MLLLFSAENHSWGCSALANDIHQKIFFGDLEIGLGVNMKQPNPILKKI
jgi:hypothetical protein